MIHFIQKYPFAFLMLVSVMLLLPHLGMIQTNIMETRNLISAREMVNNGHWIFTTLNGLPRYVKPPLPTWITAICMMLFGTNNMFLLRLPAVLMCLMLVYFFYKLMQYFKLEDNQPLNASLILITSFYIFFGGRDNQWDIYTHAFTLPCIYYLFKSFNENNSTTKYVIISGLCLACSCLSKGPVSLYGLLLPAVIAYCIVYKNNIGKKIRLCIIVFLIGMVLGFSWYFFVKFSDAAAAHALSKETKNWSNYEVKPFYYYWNFFMQSGIWTIPSFIGLMYFYLHKHVQDKQAYTFSFLWTIISLLLLSVIPEKKPRYTLPVLIPLAMNTSFYIQYLFASFKQLKNKLETGLVYFNFGLIALIGLATPFAILFLFKQMLFSYIFWYSIFVIVCLGSSFLLIKHLYQQKFPQAFYISILFMCGIVITLIPLSKIFYTNTKFYAACNLHATEKKYGIKTYQLNEFEPEIIWSYGDIIPSIPFNDSIAVIPKDSMFGLLMNQKDEKKYIAQFSNYDFKKQARVDLNDLPENKKKYNDRLVKDYFIVKKF